MSEPPSRQVIVRQLCTGCAVSRDVRVTLEEAQRLRDLPIPEREKHADCYPTGGATRSEWFTTSGRWAPDAPTSNAQTPESAS